MRNLIGLVLVLLGIFLMFIPSNRQEEEVVAKAAEEYIPISTATGMDEYYVNKNRTQEATRSARDYARSKVSDKEFYYLDQLVYLESKWDNEAQNPYSTAYGIGQFLDQTWETVGYEKTDDPYKQVDAMIDYVYKRYGSFETALSAWYQRSENSGHGWY